LNWNHDRVVYYMLMCFLNRLHDGVVNNLRAIFPHLSFYRVVDDLFVGLMYRHHDGVVDHFFVCFVHWLLNRVVDDLFMGLIHWLHNCVVNFTCTSFPHWTAYVVRNRLGVSLMYWAHNRVVTSLGLVHRLANDFVDSAITCLGNHPSYVDHFVFGDVLVFGTCTLFGTLFVNRFAYSFHDCVGCRYFRTTVCTAATIVVADSATISSVSYSSGHCCQHSNKYRYNEQPSHSRSPWKTYTDWMPHLEGDFRPCKVKLADSTHSATETNTNLLY